MLSYEEASVNWSVVNASNARVVSIRSLYFHVDF